MLKAIDKIYEICYYIINADQKGFIVMDQQQELDVRQLQKDVENGVPGAFQKLQESGLQIYDDTGFFAKTRDKVLADWAEDERQTLAKGKISAIWWCWIPAAFVACLACVLFGHVSSKHLLVKLVLAVPCFMAAMSMYVLVFMAVSMYFAERRRKQYVSMLNAALFVQYCIEQFVLAGKEFFKALVRK